MSNLDKNKAFREYKRKFQERYLAEGLSPMEQLNKLKAIETPEKSEPAKQQNGPSSDNS
jgi:hypothetical protein